MPSTSGWSWPRRSSSDSSASNSWDWASCAPAGAVELSRSSGSSVPSWPRADGESSSSTGSLSRASERSTATIGAYGSSSPPSSTQSPHSTRAPRSRACTASSDSRRDLPTPDSPAMNASDGRPSAASDSAASSSVSSALRPTRRLLVTRVATNVVSPPGRAAWAGFPFTLRGAARSRRGAGDAPAGGRACRRRALQRAGRGARRSPVWA